MNSRLRIRLQTTPVQALQLQALQALFVQACNELAQQARAAGVWSRIGLHQLAYHGLRQRFPALGAQMVCNVIYSVSRAARLVFQHPASPLHGRARAGAAAPRLCFGPEAPVYFDRHTLNVRDGQASMYSLDGRLRFNLPLDPEHEHRLRHGGIREIALGRDAQGLLLDFLFAHADATAPAAAAQEGTDCPPWPDYLLLLDEPEAAAEPAAEPVAEPGAEPAAESSAESAAVPLPATTFHAHRPAPRRAHRP